MAKIKGEEEKLAEKLKKLAKMYEEEVGVSSEEAMAMAEGELEDDDDVGEPVAVAPAEKAIDVIDKLVAPKVEDEHAKAAKEAKRKRLQESLDRAAKSLVDLDDSEAKEDKDAALKEELDALAEEVEEGPKEKKLKWRKGKAADILSQVGRATKVEASKTTLVHDAWSRRRGTELSEEPSAKKLGMGADECADFHGMNFLPEPEFESHVEDKVRSEYLQRLYHSTDFKSMHMRTCRDDVASELAAINFGKQYHEYLEERKKREEAAEGKGEGKGKGKGAGASVGSGSGDDDESSKAEKKAMDKSLDKAAKDTEKDLDELDDTKSAFGFGGHGAAPSKADADVIAKLHKKVRKSTKLKTIMALAGKFRRLAAGRQKSKTKHGIDEVVGTEQGNEIERLLPQELAKLADETLELETMRRLVERQTLQREVSAMDYVGKGPIIVVIDESGSMGGDKNETAKALGLAMAWIAKKQRRWIALVSYTGCGSWNRQGEWKVITNHGGAWNPEEMAKWLEQFLGGGGDRDLPIIELPEIYKTLKAPVGKTDVIMVSDCIITHLPKEVIDNFNTWRKEVKANVMTIVIQAKPGQLKEMSDQVFTVDAITTSTDAVEAAVSI